MDGSFKEHGFRLYLDKTLYKALVRLQADKGLGRSYAGLLPLVEGLHSMGYLTNQECEERIKKYSQPLCDVPPPPTMEELQRKSELVNWEKRFSRAIEQWSTMPEESREWHVQKARELQDKVSKAKFVLSLANREQRNDEELATC
jgi:hypothetical protein